MADTGYKDSLGNDIDTLLEPLGDGIPGPDTGYKNSAGVDLAQLYYFSGEGGTPVDGTMAGYNIGAKGSSVGLGSKFAEVGSVSYSPATESFSVPTNLGSASRTTGISTTSGSYYFEATAQTFDHSSAFMIGFVESTNVNVDNAWTLDNTAFAFGYNGSAYNKGAIIGGYMATYTTGDIIGVKFSFDNDVIAFSKNGVWGADIPYTFTGWSALHPTLACGGGGFCNAQFNYGADPFVYAIPNGFTAYPS